MMVATAGRTCGGGRNLQVMLGELALDALHYAAAEGVPATASPASATTASTATTRLLHCGVWVGANGRYVFACSLVMLVHLRNMLVTIVQPCVRASASVCVCVCVQGRRCGWVSVAPRVGRCG